MAWITPIYDRTLADVAAAQANQASTSDMKGALNVSDLNRIENNVSYLATLLRARGYEVYVSVKTNWVIEDIPSLEHLSRIAGNIEKILSAYSVADDMRDITVGDGIDYEVINSMELDLYYVYAMMQSMDSIYAFAGVYRAAAVGYIINETFSISLMSSDGYDLYGGENFNDIELYARTSE